MDQDDNSGSPQFSHYFDDAPGFIYCQPVADNEDDALMDFLEYLIDVNP